MPAVFFGHGSPLNALAGNRYTQAWARIGATVPKPRAILAVSAHWYIRGTAVTAMQTPRTIHDFGNFPKALFEFQYPAPGDPALAARVRDVLAPLIAYESLGDDARRSIPTPEHYLPLLYIIGLQGEEEPAAVAVDGVQNASISMLSVVIGALTRPGAPI